jgi:uncharacterized protein
MNPDQKLNLITKRRVVIGAAILAVLAVFYVGMSWYVVGQALQGEVIAFDNVPEEFGLTYEDVEFSPRGDASITLRGWWFPVEDAIGSIIWVHGLDQTRAENVPLLRDLINEGFSVLAFDLRGHGQSDIVPLGAGYKEPADVRGAIDFVLEAKGASEVLLMGNSFGASVMLIAAAGEPAVAGVYADSPFASLTDLMIAEISKRTPFPAWFASMLRPGIVQIANMKGIKIDEVRPEVAVTRYGETNLVLGLAHCLADERIPVEHSYRIREAAADTGVWFNRYPRCEHTEAYDDFTEQYISIVVNYFLDQLGLLETLPQ